MMQISSTLPSHNLNSFHHKGVGFQCRASSALNPAPHIDKTKLHLSNLDKILKTKPPSPELDPSPTQKPVKPADAIRGGILQGLNLPWALPEEEIVSPNHLQRLVPMAEAEHSPRNHIASRWREYHGTNNWAGLLDPLDENLRREVVRYGEFVQAAYNTFHSGPASVHQKISMLDRAYRVTKSLYATSSVGLPKWLDDVAPDLGWMTQRSSCIGYVAVCQDEKEIARMGRRDIVIALRGTSTCLEWAENFRNILVQLPDSSSQPDQDNNNNNNNKAKVECGFLKLFKTHGERVPSLAESVVQEVKRLMQQYKGEELSISVTGHSLGAALALLVADEVSQVASSPIAVFSFGGPRVGNRAFAKRLETRGVKVLRVVNKQDVVTKMPGLLVNHEEVEKKLRASGVAREVMDVVDEWVYSHVGTELAVETRRSPYLRPDADVACCHDLEAYLHLVDGYLASDGPFRANAKRSLVKLLTEQGSNVKRLYTSKAKTLTRLNVQREAQVSS